MVAGLGRWLSSHIAMRFREIQGLAHDDPLDDLVLRGYLISAKNTDEFLELFGMAELLFKCQDLLVCRRKMSQFFMVVGRALYVSREEISCVVEYGRDHALMQEQVIPFTSHSHICDQIADALSNQDTNSNCEIRAAVSIGVQCVPNAECTIQLPGSCSMSDHEVQTDHDMQDSMAVDDNNVKCSVELLHNRAMSDHEVQTDHDIQDPMAVDDTNVECLDEVSGSRAMIDHEVQTDIVVQDSVAFDNSNTGIYDAMAESDCADYLQPDGCMSGEYDVSVPVLFFLHCN
jgi:hypothetical protein